jgi:uncharacterized protein with HEPN domain
MPSKNIVRVLAAIAYNIALARRLVEGMSFDAFAEAERTLYAVTRCLEIISEASRRLPEDLKARHPDVPWARIAGAGNVYRHDHEDVLAQLLWITVQEQLTELDEAVAIERARPAQP